MFLEMHFASKELKQNDTVNVLLPHDYDNSGEPYKTLWLLHGLSGNHNSWMRLSSIERYATEYKLAVIMPCVNRSWYTNTAYGVNYFNFVTKELPELCHKTFSNLSSKKENNIIAGLSMGGYGAVKAALTYPEQYGSCISLSGALDITRKGRTCDLAEWRSIFGLDIESALALPPTKVKVSSIVLSV